MLIVIEYTIVWGQAIISSDVQLLELCEHCYCSSTQLCRHSEAH